MKGRGPTVGILTFLRADVRGYTAFTQAQGDEAAARLAAKFAKIAQEGIEAHGGELVGTWGDEALGKFSSPRAALRAAADLQTIFADETAIEPGLPLPVGIGLDAGEAVPVQGSYMGGAVNLAARLGSLAQPGEVLLSQEVAHLAKSIDGIRFESNGETAIKGLSEPVQVLRAVFERPALIVPDGRLGVLPQALNVVVPIVGREAELRRLRWTWRLARRGDGRAVVVMGPAGIGKTRLIAELAAMVAAETFATAYTSFADAPPTGFLALRDASNPTLIALDDLDCADTETLHAVIGGIDELAASTILIVLAFDDERATPELLAAAHRLTEGDDGIVRPQPLNLDQMLRIAGLYLGSAAASVPHDVLLSTGGNPRKVHEEVSAWAHREAARRLGALATQAASDRGGLRSLEAELAGTVIDLQLVREQAMLFGVGPGRHAPENAQSPYRGLASFETADAEFFFGRERLVAEMISRLAGARLLGVLGPSGSGKSSAVRAGLVPALSAGVLPGSENWIVVVARPGEHPSRAVERALWAALPSPVLDKLAHSDVALRALPEALDSDRRLVLVIDQFEEMFTSCSDEAEREVFVAAITDAARDARGNVTLVVAIRADYYGRCSAYPGLAELMASNQVLVGPMTAEEYRRAIVQPALRVGVVVEPELVDDLVAEVVGQAGALPLLSTALVQLWDQREGRSIRRATYLTTGGVHGAVARLAEQVYASFDETRQGIARSILLRLAGSGTGESVVRRRVSLAEFDAERDVEVAAVLETLANRRLVTISDGAAEVAHEALLREWPRLQGWLEEDREGRRLHAHLAATARDWQERGQDAADLYRGARLSAALDWTAEHNLELNELERQFITTSRVHSQQELNRQRRQNRRLRGLLAGVAALLVVALVAGSVAVVQRQSADASARQALARQLGAEALVAPRIDQAMLLAREAVLLDRSTQTEGTLLATLLRSPAVIGAFTTPITVRPLQIVLSPDGRTLAVAGNNGQIAFYDSRTYRQSHTPLNDYGNGFGPEAMLYGGPHFFAVHTPPGNTPPTFEVRDASSMRLIRSLPVSQTFFQPTGLLNPLVASPDGQHLYFCFSVTYADGSDGPAYIDSYDVAAGSFRQVLVGSNGMNGAGMVPGNRLMVVTDNAAVTLDGTTLQPISSVPVHLNPGFVAVSPDGGTLAISDAETFSLLDLRAGRTTPASGSQQAAINGLSFTPDGRYVVTVSVDNNATIWDGKTATLIETLHGHSSSIIGLAISADGRTLYTSSLDGAIFEWDLSGTRRFGRRFDVSTSGPLTPRDEPASFAVSPDGAHFAARTAPGTVSIFSVRTLRQEQSISLRPGLDFFSMAWSRNQLLALGEDPGIQIFDVRATPVLKADLPGLPGRSTALAFSADGRTIAVATGVAPSNPTQPSDGYLSVWDTRSGKLRLDQHVGARGMSVAIDPRARVVAVGLDDPRVLVLDLDSGKLRQTIRPAGGSTQSMAFRADGTLVTGSWAGIVQRWDPLSGRQFDHPILAAGGPLASLSIAPDQATFATSGGAVKLWDVETLQQFGSSLASGRGGFGVVRYTPDGSNLLVFNEDGSGSLWPVSVRAWMNHACDVAHRNFTSEEWARFVPGHAYAQVCPAYPPG